jgi:beta-glucosidase
MPILFPLRVRTTGKMDSRAAGWITACMLAVVFLLRLAPSSAQGGSQPWMDGTLLPEQRARALLAAMTTEEKIAMVHGDSTQGYVGRVPENTRLGIPALITQDGPAGVAGGLTLVTAFPAPITVAASWDTDLMRRYGEAIAEEQRDKGANVQLGPMMNINRVPRAGRNFEGYGEDPYLAAQMAAAAVRGIQGRGVIAVAKHYIDNDQEYLRTTISVVIDLRTQHEIYLPPFLGSVRAGVGAVMCSYNRILGVHACENAATQNGLLKGELGFQGWIMSDWGATHSAADSANNGLDMEMPSGVYFTQLLAAVDAGQVPAGRLDDMVFRILAVMFRMGLFDRAPAGSIGADAQSAAHSLLARDAAAQGIVLLKNDDHLLPLDKSKIRSIAVFGSAAETDPIVTGGGSAHVTPTEIVTPLQGIIARAGAGVTVRYFNKNEAVGSAVPAEVLQTPQGARGLLAEYFNNPDLSGDPALTRIDPNIDFNWGSGSPGNGVDPGGWSARWTGTLTAPDSGRYNLALIGRGGSRLYIDDQLVADNWGGKSAPTKIGKKRLEAGKTYAIRVEYARTEAAGDFRFSWFKPSDNTNDEAAAIARQSDVAVVVSGVSPGEGADQQSLNTLDNELIAAVARANPRTIVVGYTPAQVLMPWVDQVPAILLGWIPGQEGGNALASVLFGDLNPSGKLPVTLAKSEADFPAGTREQYPGVDGQVYYTEGLLVGYRHFDSRDIQPVFPFGHGLSYTTFEYSNLSIDRADVSTEGNLTVRVDVTNTGPLPGAEVAQLYLGFPHETSEPPRQLKGFQKVFLKPGETRRVSFPVGAEDFSFWSAGYGTWVAYPGAYQVMVGSSSRDIRQTGSFTVHGGPLAGEVFQAEAAALSGNAAVLSSRNHYTGSGFVGGLDQANAAAAFMVTVDSAGEYYAILRYSSAMRSAGPDQPRTLSVYVNGVKIGQTRLPSLANWDTWDFKSETLTLQAGENAITYQYDTGDRGEVFLDALTVEKVAATAPSGATWIAFILLGVTGLFALAAGGRILLRRRPLRG